MGYFLVYQNFGRGADHIPLLGDSALAAAQAFSSRPSSELAAAATVDFFEVDTQNP